MSLRADSIRLAACALVLCLAAGCPRGERSSAGAEASFEVGGSWPIFRGDPALSGLADGELAEKLRLVWSFETGGEIISSAVVGDGRVYVGSGDGKVYALSQKNGKELWSFDTGDAVEAPPLLAYGNVFVGSVNGVLYAFDARTGDRNWEFTTEEMIVGSANRVSVSGTDCVLVGSHDFSMYCLNGEDGDLVWRYESENYINGAPAIAGDIAVFGGCDEDIHVVSVLKGKGIGLIGGGSYIAASCSVREGRAFVGNYGNTLVCADLKSKKVLWEYGDKENGAPFFSSPAVTDDSVVIGCRDSKVHCVDREKGVARWTCQTGGAVDSSPVVCDGKVVVGSDDGRLYLLRLTDGEKLWSYDIGSEVSGSPAVVSGMVIVCAYDGKVYAFAGAEQE